MAGRGGQSNRWGALACLLAVLALALVAAGCGGSDDDSDDSTKKGAAGHKQAADESTDLEDWPMFGRIKTRTHHLGGKDLDPPLEETWAYQEGVLIEFPPALYDGVLYLADKAGDVRAIRASTGDTIWHNKGAGSANGAPDDTTGARLLPRPRLRRDAARRGLRARPRDRQGAVAQAAADPARVLPAGHPRHALHRLRQGDRLRARHAQRQDPLAVQGLCRARQDEPLLRRGQGLLRRLRRHDPRDQRQERQAGLVHRHRRQARLRAASTPPRR